MLYHANPCVEISTIKMNCSYLENCIFYCGALSNCARHNPKLLFGIICEKHLELLFVMGTKHFVSHKPAKSIFYGPWLSVARFEELHRNEIFFVYKKVFDYYFNDDKSSNEIHEIHESIINYFKSDEYLKSNNWLKIYQLEVYRNLTCANDEIDVMVQNSEKAESLKKVINNIHFSIKSIYDRNPFIKTHCDNINIRSGFEVIKASQLSYIEQIMLLFLKCGGVYDNIDSKSFYNFNIVKEKGWIALKKIENPNLLCLKGQIINKQLEDEKISLFQRIITDRT